MTQASLAVLAAIICGSASPPQEAEGTKAAKKTIEPVVRGLLRAAVAGDHRSIGARVHRDGIPCGDVAISRAEVLRDLRTTGGDLHGIFFDGESLRRKYMTSPKPLSLKEFQQRGDRIEIHVQEVTVDEKKREPLTCCARLVARNLEYEPTFCFFKDGSRWYLASAEYFCQ